MNALLWMVAGLLLIVAAVFTGMKLHHDAEDREAGEEPESSWFWILVITGAGSLFLIAAIADAAGVLR